MQKTRMRIFGYAEKIAVNLPHKVKELFYPMRKKLVGSGLLVNFDTYLGFLVLFSLASCLLSSVLAYVLLNKQSNYSFIQSLLSSMLFGLFFSAITGLICFTTPYLLADNRGRIIDATLPSIANYMSILATTGMTTANIIISLGRVSEEFNVKAEMDLIITDIETLGYDLYEALRHAYDLSPSHNFANLLFGVVSVSQMGGDLSSYLRNQAEKNTNRRLLLMRGFIDNLAIIAEVYITIMIVGPLMLIVMLTVMSFLGGDATLGGLPVPFVMNFLTFVFIPIGIILLVLAVEATSPVN